MAKLVGLFGKASGKKGDAILAVNHGDQIMRQWNPIVKDANSAKQVATRARMKLMSQLGAIFEPIIAIKREKGASSRNMFTKVNFPKTSFTGATADINLKGVQLTKSPNAFPTFQADRSKNTIIECWISQGNINDYDAVVYACVEILDDQRIRVHDSVLVTNPGTNRDFYGTMAYSAESIVVYAYGIYYNSGEARATYENIEGEAAQHIAQLYTENRQSISGSVLTGTNGLVMPVGVNTASSDDIDRRTLSITVVGNGTTTGQGSYAEGTVVNAVATPGSGASFQGWYRGGVLVSSNTTYQVTMTENIALEARFSGQSQQVTLSLTAEPAVGGSVTGGGTYEPGTTVHAIATANSGYVFGGWYKNNVLVSSNIDYSFAISENTILTAKFNASAQTYNLALSASPVGGGTVSGGGSFEAGTTATALATPASGYRFVGWYENNTQVSTNNSYQVTMNADHSLEGRFEPNAAGTITVTLHECEDGTVHTEYDQDLTGAGTYTIGDTVNIDAPSGEHGLTFQGWYNDDVSHPGRPGTRITTNRSYSFTASENVVLYAYYTNGYE